MHANLGILTFCIFVSNGLVKACSEEDLIMIQLLSAHGQTAPLEQYPTDPNPLSLWKEGLGDLTMLGKFREYVLGLEFRLRYVKFITTDPREVEVYSSSHNACVKGALSFITAMYQPTPDWEIVKDFPYQPVIVRYMPKGQDKYFEMLQCPAADREYEKILASPGAAAFISKYQDLFDYWSRHSGWKIKNWDDVDKLYSVLDIERAYNLSIPFWAMKYWEEMELITDTAPHWKFGTPLMQRLRAGPLLKLVLERMKKKAAGGIPEKKVFLYKTYRDNVAAVLSALNIFNFKKPPFYSTLSVELFEHDNEHFVRFLYMNASTPETYPQVLHLLNLEGCDEFCPLDYVIDYAEKFAPANWEAECDRASITASSES